MSLRALSPAFRLSAQRARPIGRPILCNTILSRSISFTKPCHQKSSKFESDLNVSPKTQKATPPSKEKLFEQEKRGQKLHSLLKAVSVKQMLDKKGSGTIIVIDEDQTVFEAVRLMSEKGVGAVVVASKGKPRGIFTERDYMTKLILKGRASKDTPIKEVTEYKLSTVTADTSLDECAALMVKKIIRHLPIVGEDGSLVGMMSVRDIAEHMVQAGFLATDLQLAKNPDTVEDVFNQLGRISSEECFVQSADSVLKALQLMDKHRIGAVFVLNGQTLVGIFTERDYLHKVRLQEKASKTTLVEDVMTKRVVTVSPAEQIGKCLDIMVKGKFRNLPVVPMIGDEVDSGEYRTVMGIITLVDVIRFMYKLGVDSAQK